MFFITLLDTSAVGKKFLVSELRLHIYYACMHMQYTLLVSRNHKDASDMIPLLRQLKNNNAISITFFRLFT